MKDHTISPKKMQVSLFKHHVEVGKSFSRDETGKLISQTNGTLINAQVERIEFDHISEMIEIQDEATGYQHLTVGVNKLHSVTCVPEKNRTDGLVSRTEKHFKAPIGGHAGIICIDSDGVDGSPRDQLITVFPFLADTCCVETTSSSSNIYSKFGAELRGDKGFHTFYTIDKPKKIPDILDIMHQRLMIAGHDMSKSSTVGSYLERTCVDKMLGNSSQPIYMKANLSDDLIQDKEINYHHGSVDRLSSDLFTPLTTDELMDYHSAVEVSKARLAPVMREKRAEWLENQPNTTSAELALEHQVLDGDFELDTYQGRIKVKDLTPSHHGITCRNPFGDGRGSFTQAMIFNMQDVPMVISHAHGGMKYRLVDASKVGFGQQGLVINNDTGIVENLPAPVITTISRPNTDMRLGADIYNPLLISNGNSIPMQHYQNFYSMISKYGISIRLNVIMNEIEFDGLSEFNYNNDCNATAIKDLCTVNQMKDTKVDNYILKCATNNEYNPIVEMVNRHKWDGKPRVRALFDTLHVISDDLEVEYKLFYKWMMGAYRIGTDQTETFPFVLVLQRQAGGEGKSAWLKRLAVDDKYFISTNFDVKNKDDLIKSTNVWIAEFGELDSIFVKSELKALMLHLTNSHDKIRVPYAKSAVDRKRRTAYTGTVNTEQFLRDDSGDRRFWGFRVGEVDYMHDINMQQVWAEIAVTSVGKHHWLDREENKAVIERNKQFKVEDPIIEQLEMYFARDIIGDEKVFLNATQIAEKMKVYNLKNTKLKFIKSWLKDHGYKVVERTVNGHRLRGFIIPTFHEQLL